MLPEDRRWAVSIVFDKTHRDAGFSRIWMFDIEDESTVT